MSNSSKNFQTEGYLLRERDLKGFEVAAREYLEMEE